MAYLSTEEVKAIRVALKAKFPKVKMSITGRNYSGVQIVILESHVDFPFANRQINEYSIKHDFKGEAFELLSGILEIAEKGTTYHETSDYGTQPSHYVWIEVGQYNKPYVCKK